eukprot:3782068-Amphidinium_carterae.1
MVHAASKKFPHVDSLDPETQHMQSPCVHQISKINAKTFRNFTTETLDSPASKNVIGIWESSGTSCTTTSATEQSVLLAKTLEGMPRYRRQVDLLQSL